MTNLYFYESFVIALFIVELIAAIIYFASVWVRQGYAGHDKQLDLFETGVYYKHVVGFLFVLIATGMIFIPPIISYTFPDAAWIFLGGIFAAIMGTELYMDIKKSIVKTRAQTETDADKTLTQL